jgi:hypothetical protein
MIPNSDLPDDFKETKSGPTPVKWEVEDYQTTEC